MDAIAQSRGPLNSRNALNFAPSAQSVAWPLAAFVIVILLQIELVFNRPVNWDEFYHLSQAHMFIRGDLTEALQVLYARAFFWVPLLPIDAIDQIRTVRVFMLVCELFTVLAIFAMASRFTHRLPSAFAALAYLTAGYVFQHGFSYRADPMAAAFLMGALWIMLASKLDAKAILGTAILAGLAALTTIKVVFYAPAFAAVAWLRWKEAAVPREMLLRLAVLFGASTLCVSLFIGLTILSLPENGAASAEHTVSTSASMVFHEGLFPRWPYLFGLMATAPVLALLVISSPLELARAKLQTSRWVAVAGMMLPLASIVLYRNSFPYFYAFILPPVMIAAAVAAQALLAHIRPAVLAIVLVANATIISCATPREILPLQQQVIAAAHEIFPEPVAYFDFPGMIVDYPKANFFMSTWGVKKYWTGIFPTFREVMSRETVPLLVLNQETLERNQMGPEPAWELLPEDAKALREGFIQHWGPLWVAGRTFPADEQTTQFEIFAPGIYTLEGTAARIDGRNYLPGQTPVLERGLHGFERIGKGKTSLRWGDHLIQPTEPFAGGPVFKDF